MFHNMENLKIVNVLYGISSISRDYTNRPYHGLVFKIDGESVYTFSSGSATLSKNQLIYLPRGEAFYHVRRVNEGESKYAVINFEAAIPNAAIKLYHPEAPNEILLLIDKLRKELLVESASSQFESMALFYKILSLLHQNSSSQYFYLHKQEQIAPAIEYIKSSLFDPDLKIGELHRLCGISDTYFRKIFISVFGVAPKKYILDKRLSHAKNILDSGEYSYIYEVASAVGFEDPLYFSKCFKGKYGYYPSRYESTR